jgi:neurofibromin 1
MLKDSTHERFPGCEHAAIGSFIFLRFICPAIVSPEGFGIVTGNYH